MATDTTENVKRRRIFVTSDQVTDNESWYCGDEEFAAREGIMNVLTASLPGAIEELKASGKWSKIVIGFEVREMTDAEVKALPDG